MIVKPPRFKVGDAVEAKSLVYTLILELNCCFFKNALFRMLILERLMLGLMLMFYPTIHRMTSNFSSLQLCIVMFE
jgi:hypothetical protein